MPDSSPDATGNQAHGRPRPARQRTPRKLGHGDLRLLLLALLEPQPRHGYELIQLIGEIFHGQYQPSAGAVYPALAQLQADGLADVREEGARRLHALTDLGRTWVEENAVALAQARLRTEASARTLVKAGAPAPVRSGMSALKRALASHGTRWGPGQAEAVAAILQQAAADIAQVGHD